MLDDFKPIARFNGRYEINSEGVVRNATNKYILSPYRNAQALYYSIWRRNYSRRRLLFEVHGLVAGRMNSKVPVTLSKGAESYRFESSLSAAKYLSPRVYYSVVTLCRRFSERIKDISGWRVNYEEDCNV